MLRDRLLCLCLLFFLVQPAVPLQVPDCSGGNPPAGCSSDIDVDPPVAGGAAINVNVEVTCGGATKKRTTPVRPGSTDSVCSPCANGWKYCVQPAAGLT
jgi:hypothetical protein